MPYAKRLRKKRAGQLLDKILETGYFIDCNYHPVKLTEYSWGSKDLYGSDVSGISLTTGKGSSCSIFYCGPEPITEAIALEMASVYKDHGNKGLAIRYGGYTEEQYDEFEKMWRQNENC